MECTGHDVQLGPVARDSHGFKAIVVSRPSRERSCAAAASSAQKHAIFVLTGPAQTQSLFVCVCTRAAGVTGLEARDSVRRAVSEDVARLMLAAYPKANLGLVASVVF